MPAVAIEHDLVDRGPAALAVGDLTRPPLATSSPASVGPEQLGASDLARNGPVERVGACAADRWGEQQKKHEHGTYAEDRERACDQPARDPRKGAPAAGHSASLSPALSVLSRLISAQLVGRAAFVEKEQRATLGSGAPVSCPGKAARRSTGDALQRDSRPRGAERTEGCDDLVAGLDGKLDDRTGYQAVARVKAFADGAEKRGNGSHDLPEVR